MTPNSRKLKKNTVKNTENNFVTDTAVTTISNEPNCNTDKTVFNSSVL